MILHRGSETSGYWVDDYPIEIARDHFGPGWRILLVDTLSVEHELVRDWYERNRDILNQIYPRLNDARQALEALLTLDPLPMDPLFPASRLRRTGPGRYEAADGKGQTFDIVRSGQRWKVIKRSDGSLLVDARSIWEVRLHLTT